ncbi:rifin PIR protein,putative [Plasmodium sp. DRC-Itaito]|nr:rifin PIR protein,putative [Plasmodium sp. DRC-Itaito]
MKLYFLKILLLFFLPLNILLTLYQVYNKNNEPYVTTHHKRIYTPRVLSECDIQSSIYDKDAGMKSVMQQFVARTSQRFEEYKERLKEKRQKRKEQRDKNIQKIIEKDKREKSLEEKVEKGCLRCGCGLGGGVLPIWGLVSGLWYATLSQHVTKMATDAGIQKGISTVVAQLGDVAERFRNSPIDILGMINAETYRCPQALTTAIYVATEQACAGSAGDKPAVCARIGAGGNKIWYGDNVLEATKEGIAAAKSAEKIAEAKYASTTSSLTAAISASIIAIVVIVLIMVIIYLILRRRRKKKMKKKLQYIKVLEE